MENWKAGDIAICVITGKLPKSHLNGVLPTLRLNAEYIVQKIHVCDCGHIMLDIGLGISTQQDPNLGVLCDCGASTSPKSGIHWCSSQRFVKKILKSIEEQMSDAIENEDYELADQLQKQLTTTE